MVFVERQAEARGGHGIFQGVGHIKRPDKQVACCDAHIDHDTERTGVTRFELDGLSVYGILCPRYRRELVGFG